MWVLFLNLPAFSFCLDHINVRQVSSLLDTSHHQSLRGDRPEKSIMRECVHARPSAFRSLIHRKQAVFITGPLTHRQEVGHLSMSECEKVVEIGCSFGLNREAIIVGLVTGFASRLLVTQDFLFTVCKQPLVRISFALTACASEFTDENVQQRRLKEKKKGRLHYNFRRMEKIKSPHLKCLHKETEK